MSLPRWSVCCFILLFFAVCGVTCERNAAGYELRTLSRRGGAHFAVERSLKSTVEEDALDMNVEGANSGGIRNILQAKAKDEPSDEEEEEENDTTESDKMKDEATEKGGTKGDSETDMKKTDEMTEEEENSEGKAEDKTEPKDKAKADEKAKPKAGTKAEDEAQDDDDKTEKVVENGSGKKEGADAKIVKGSGKTNSKPVSKASNKGKTEAEPEAKDKDATKTENVDMVSAKKEKAGADSEASEASTNKDRKSEGKSKKVVKAEAEAAEKKETDNSSEGGKGTDSVTKKGGKKKKTNKTKKGSTTKTSKEESKTDPETVEPKKAPAPVVKKKERPTLPSDCVWDADSKFCFVDKEPFAKILSKARTKSGKVLRKEYECLELNQVSCNRNEACEWRGSCHSSAYTNAQSKCFRKDSAFIYHMDGTCDTHEDQSSCSLNEKCTWLLDQQICAVDFIKAFTGISIDGQEVRDARSARNSELQLAFDSNLSNFILNPDSILDWTLPDFKCLDDAEPDFCKFIEVFDREFVLNAHCGAKYDINDISDCNLDPLCEISSDGACGISPVMRNEVSRTGSEVLSTLAGTTLGTQYIELINLCQKGPSNVEGEGCPSGCLAFENACIVDTDTFIRESVLKSKAFKSGQCKGFPLVHKDSGCSNLEAKACQNADVCSLDADDVCIPDERAVILSALLQLERPVANAVKAISTKCGSLKTAGKCEKPKVL